MMRKRLLEKFLSYWERITRPLVPLDSVESEMKSRFMAALLLTIAFLVSVLLPPRYLIAGPLPLALGRLAIAWSSALVLWVGYLLVRRGHHRLLAKVIIAYGTAIILGTTIYIYPQAGLFTLYYMVIVSFFAAAMLSLSGALVVISAQAVGMLAIGLWIKASIWEILSGPLAFHLSLSLIVAFLMRYNRQLLAEQNRRYQQLFDQAPIAIWNEDFSEVMRALNALRAEGVRDLAAHLDAHPELAGELFRKIRVRDVNATAVRISNAPNREALIHNLSKLSNEESLKSYREELLFLWEGRTHFTREFSSVRYDGQPVHNLANFSIPLKNGQPDYSDVILSITDLTEQKEAEKERLLRALERERMALVEHLMEALSHDFRTSLSSIETSRYLIERSLERATPDQLRQRLEVIRANVFHLTQQLDNLSIVASFTQHRAAPLDLNDLARQVVTYAGQEARERGLRLDFQPAADLPMIIGYEHELRRALIHLLDNAFAHTPSGGAVTVRTQILDTATDVAIEVADTGVGIDNQHLPHIFDFFYRGDTARSTQTGGVGLGLSIVRMVAEGHKGRVVVDSRPKEGTTFRLILPARLGVLG